MAKISELQIKIGADASALKRELSESQAALKTAFSTKPIDSAGAAISEVSKKTGAFISQWKGWVSMASGAFGFADLIAGAVQAGAATYALTTRLGISAAEAGQLSRTLKLTGGDIDSCAKSIMRLDKSFSAEGKSGDKTRETLDAYGVSLTDVNGKLLPVNEQLQNLAKGYKQAKGAGNEQAFLMDTLGVKGMALAQTLDQYSEASKTASKVKSIGINPQEMHELAQQMQVMQMEAGQLKLAFAAALAPVAKEIFPVLTQGLTSTAKLFSENKEEIREIAKDLAELATLYKAVQFARVAAPKIQQTWNAAKIMVSPSAARDAAAQKEQEALAARQDALIAKRTAEIERSYDRQRQAAIKAATQMNLSAEETSTLIATRLQEIELKASETATRVAEAMRAGFAQSAQAATASTAETKAVLTETGAAATAASAKIAESHAAEAESTQVAVAAERENAAAHGETALASEAAAGRVAAAHAAEAESAQVSVAAQTQLTTATTAAGNAATAAGNKGVLAGTKASGAVAKTTANTKGLTAQTTVAGVTSQRSMLTMERGALSAAGKVKQLAGAVLLLATNWWLAVAAFAAYQGAKAAESYAEKKGQETYELNGKTYYHNDKDGAWYTREKTQTIPAVNANGTPNFAGELLNTANLGFHNDSYNMARVTDIDTLKELNKKQSVRFENSAAGKAAAAAQEAKNAQANAEDQARRVAAETAGLGDLDMSIAGAGAGSDSGGGSAASEKPATPMRTKYSFEDNPLLAGDYANEIIYTANQWGYDPRILASLILARENKSANPTLWSEDGRGNYGLTQIAKGIADEYAGGKGWGDADWGNNIWAGGSYLGDLIRRYGDVRAGLLAYNAGPGNYNEGRYDSSYANDIMAMAKSMTTSQITADGTASAAKPTVVQVPIGYAAIEEAEKYLNTGYKDELSNRCADFVSKMYVDAGIAGIDHVENGNTLAQKFKGRGAYHTADSGYTPQAGDLVDWEGHVGIYVGNGQYIARNSHQSQGDASKVHMGPVSEGESWGYGKLLGYGSVGELTGGATVPRTMMQGDQAAMEALKKQQELIEQKNKLMADLQSKILESSGTAYQKDLNKVESDLRKRALDINKLAGQGVDVTDLRKTFSEYTTLVTREFAEKWQITFAAFVNTAKTSYAQARHDYETQADLEYEATVRKLDKERKENEKNYMKDKDDVAMRMAINDEYYAKLQEAEEKHQKSLREAHDKTIQYLEQEGALRTMIAYLNSDKGTQKGEESLNLKGQQKLAKEYVQVWEDAHGSMSEYIADTSNNMYSTMTSSLTDFIKGTKSAKSALQDFGNSILNMMAKIAAQRLAATWMTGLLGAFGGRSSGMNVASDLTGGLITGNFSKITSSASSFSLVSSTAFAHASGGYISGPGTGTSDDVPAWLSNGEFVMTAAATKKYQPLLQLMNAGKFAEGGIVAPIISHPSYGAMPMGSNSQKSAPGGVIVNIHNNSDGQPRVENAGYDESMQKWVLNVVIDGAERNRGGFASNMKAALKGAM